MTILFKSAYTEDSMVMVVEAPPRLRAEAELRVVKSYPEVLDEQILIQQGSYRRVRQYLRGWHRELGVLHMGWQGKETVIEKDIITASRSFRIAWISRF